MTQNSSARNQYQPVHTARGGYLRCPFEIDLRALPHSIPKGSVSASVGSAFAAHRIRQREVEDNAETSAERPWHRAGVGARSLAARDKQRQISQAKEIYSGADTNPTTAVPQAAVGEEQNDDTTGVGLVSQGCVVSATHATSKVVPALKREGAMETAADRRLLKHTVAPERRKHFKVNEEPLLHRDNIVDGKSSGVQLDEKLKASSGQLATGNQDVDGSSSGSLKRRALEEKRHAALFGTNRKGKRPQK